MKIEKFILGSTSKFRASILASLGVTFAMDAPKVDESSVGAGASPEETALLRSVLKAEAVALCHPGALVLGGDQTLGIAGDCFGKADNRKEAEERLRMFAGKRHYLHSAYALSVMTEQAQVLTVVKRVVSVAMDMRPLSDAEISSYLDTREWEGCAGCYRFEERGRQLFISVSGSESDIIGLPLMHLATDLRTIGVNLLLNSSGPWHLLGNY